MGHGGVAAAAVVAVLMLFYGTLVGWAVHRLMHKTWSGPLYRSHMVHHLEKYPPKDLESDSYRNAGASDALFVFLPASVAAALLAVGAAWALGASPWVMALMLAESAAIGWAHESAHNGQHVRGHWTSSLGRWHSRATGLHHVHHRNMRKNFGIVWFGWDRLFRTFKKP